MSNMRTRILLVDDHTLIRQGLRSLLEKEPDMEVVGETGDGQASLKLVQEHTPDVVLMDVAMPGISGVEATTQIIAHAPSTRVIGLSMYTDKRFVTGMLQAGASGYMPKDCVFEELVQGIRAVIANKTYLSPNVTRAVVKDYLHQLDSGTGLSPLTRKEREVLRLLAQGKSTREVAYRLGVSGKTIETHRRHITEKLNLRSLADLVKYAIREGLTSLNE